MTTPVLVQDRAREGDTLFRSLVEHVTDIISVLDADGRFRYVSPAVEPVLGLRPDELTGSDALDAVHPDDQPALVATLASLETLKALKRLGVLLALDDFGTGYSSLNYLRRFPVDTLKIDRSFVQELGSNASSLAIVRAVVSLAHALEMDVTAEGFETSTQLARLRDAYCDHGQGYYFSKPLPVEQMNALLASVFGCSSVASPAPLLR